MLYAEKNLLQGEKILYVANLSYISIVECLILTIVSLIMPFIMPDGEEFFIVFAILDIILGAILINLVITRYTTELVITNKRLIGKKGLFSTQTLEAPLNKITSISISKNISGHMFDFGKLNVSVFSDKYSYDFLDKPEQFKNYLLNVIPN